MEDRVDEAINFIKSRVEDPATRPEFIIRCSCRTKRIEIEGSHLDDREVHEWLQGHIQHGCFVRVGKDGRFIEIPKPEEDEEGTETHESRCNESERAQSSGDTQVKQDEENLQRQQEPETENPKEGVDTSHAEEKEEPQNTENKAHLEEQGTRGAPVDVAEGDFIETDVSETEATLIESAVVEVNDYLSLNIPPKRKILNPWLDEQSITLISGWRGVGKSWFGISVFDSISRGEPFGPWKTETPVPCLFLDGEMAAFDLQVRLKQLTSLKEGQPKSPLYIYSDAYANSLGIARANLVDEHWRRGFRVLLIKKKIKLLALDNISSLAPGIDENKKSDWDPINQWLLQLRFAGISTVLFHHLGKEGDQRGTSAREDNIDTSITLQNPPDYSTEQGIRFIVKFKKLRMYIKDPNLIADMEFRLKQDNHVIWTWGAVRKKNQVEILTMLDEEISQSDIANTLGIDKSYVCRVRNRAIKEDHLSKNNKLTKLGRAFIKSYESGDEG
jgi:hypothetical protein